jgi:hypothetical protein
MELEIRKLPFDVQERIWKHVQDLRSPKVVLSRELQTDIQTYHYLPQILDNYKSLEPDYAYLWVENAMINLLNNHQPLLTAATLEPCFHTIFPGCTDAEIKYRLLSTMDNMTKRLWRAMDARQRLELYSTSLDLHMRLCWL